MIGRIHAPTYGWCHLLASDMSERDLTSAETIYWGTGDAMQWANGCVVITISRSASHPVSVAIRLRRALLWTVINLCCLTFTSGCLKASRPTQNNQGTERRILGGFSHCGFQEWFSAFINSFDWLFPDETLYCAMHVETISDGFLVVQHRLLRPKEVGIGSD